MVMGVAASMRFLVRRTARFHTAGRTTRAMSAADNKPSAKYMNVFNDHGTFSPAELGRGSLTQLTNPSMTATAARGRLLPCLTLAERRAAVTGQGFSATI